MGHTFCEEYGMVTAPIVVMMVFPTPITAKTIRNHPVLSSLPALSRNFQGRSFRLPVSMFEQFQIIKQNDF